MKSPYPFRDLDHRERLVLHIAHHFEVPTPVLSEFYQTKKVDWLRKMFWKLHREVQESGGYGIAWDTILNEAEKVAFSPYKKGNR